MKRKKERSYELEKIVIAMLPTIRKPLMNIVADEEIVRIAMAEEGWRTSIHVASLFAVRESRNARPHENVDHNARKYEDGGEDKLSQGHRLDALTT